MSTELTDKEVYWRVVRDFLLKTIVIYAIAVEVIILIGQVYHTFGLVLAVLFALDVLYHLIKRIAGTVGWVWLIIEGESNLYVTMAHIVRWLQVLVLFVYCFYLYTQL